MAIEANVPREITLYKTIVQVTHPINSISTTTISVIYHEPQSFDDMVVYHEPCYQNFEVHGL